MSSQWSTFYYGTYTMTAGKMDIETSNTYVKKIGDLSITKEVTVNGTKDEANAGIFSFDLKVVDSTGATDETFNDSYDLTYDPVLPDGSTLPGRIEFRNGSATIQVQANRKVTIKGLPVGTIVTIRETDESSKGYAPGWTGKLVVDGQEATSANGATVTAQPINAGNVIDVTCTNTTGAALPSTGGVGTQIFTLMGTMMMLGAGVLLMLQRRRREGADAD